MIDLNELIWYTQRRRYRFVDALIQQWIEAIDRRNS